ncbi:MAG: sulfatase-like hydrolase/transferase, partial [bacterium]|nr:sulfatase-like hydrolase/transferase [bacterium]
KGMVTNFDENLGYLLERLDEMELARNTILIFLTDNGSARGSVFEDRLTGWPVAGFNAGMRGGKSSAYNGGHRVPLFVRWPGGNLGRPRDIDTLAAHIDLLPTLMELCRLERPVDPALDGVSLAPLLRGSAASWPNRTLVSQIHGGAFFRLPDDPWAGSAVMTERWRLIEGRELYDIEQDPAERHDLAKQNPAVVRRLREFHETWYAGVSEGMRPTRIVIGHDAENPSDLTSQDWFRPGGGTVWSHGHVLKRELMNGPWMIDVARTGRYRITLSRWPRYISKPIESTRARVRIADFQESRDIADPDATTEVTFETTLTAGPAKLETWLTTPSGQTHGAYFVTVERK